MSSDDLEREEPGAEEKAPPPGADELDDDGGFEAAAEREATFVASRKRLVQTAVLVVVVIGAIYFLLPTVVGVDDAIATLGRGDPLWIAVALVFGVLMFFAYVALFRGVVGEQLVHLDWRESYEITLAGLAATRFFSAGGAGGIVLTYWALRKAGMERRETAHRMVAFLVLLYAVYLMALVVDGILLRTGILSGSNPAGLTVVPAAVAGGIIALFFLMTLIPDDFERRIDRLTSNGKLGTAAQRLATAPALLASGTRTAMDFVRRPSRGGLAILGAIGFWAGNIAILWASFHAFDVAVPLGVVIQGFFVGMVANLIPFIPGGVGAVDAGMIGTFVLFGIPGAPVFAAVLTYRLIAFWLPIPPGAIAFVQLRRTVARWEQSRREGTLQLRKGPNGVTSESKVSV